MAESELADRPSGTQTGVPNQLVRQCDENGAVVLKQ